MTKRGLTPVRPSSPRFGVQPRGFGLGNALDRLAGVEPQLLRHVQALALRLRQARQDGEHRREIQHVRIEVHVAERRRAGHQLLIDARLVAVGQRIRDLDDDHAVEQRLVFLLLQELVEFREVGMRENGLVQVDEREARHLDVLLLRHGEQQVEELALHLQDLDHLEHAAAGGVHGAGPGPGARITLVADLRDLGEIHRADQVGDIRGGRIVRRVRADADARGFGEEHALDRHAHEVTFELALDVVARPGRQLALDIDAVALAELGAQARGNEIQRILAQRRALDGVQRALVGAAVFLQAALQQNGQGRFAARRRAEQQQQSTADIGAGGGRLEVIDHARQRLVDAEQLALEQLARPHALGGVRLRAARPCQRSMSQMYSWLVRAMAAGLAGRMLARNSPKVPSQRWARCSLLKELSVSMKVAFAPRESESDRIVDPSVELKIPVLRSRRRRRVRFGLT